MKNVPQYISFELAKRLKELRIPQDSYFSWSMPLIEKAKNPGELEQLKKIPVDIFRSEVNWGEAFEKFAAFTSAELGEILPKTIIVDGKKRFLIISGLGETWEVGYDGWEECPYIHDNNLANGMARLILDLRENNLIDL